MRPAESRRLRALLLSNFAQRAGAGSYSVNPDLSVAGGQLSGRTPGGPPSQTPRPGVPSSTKPTDLGRTATQVVVTPPFCARMASCHLRQRRMTSFGGGRRGGRMSSCVTQTATCESTIDALIWSIRTFKLGALERPGNMERFYTCDAGAMRKIFDCLQEKCGWSAAQIVEFKMALRSRWKRQK
jgi:hypothetical protein